MTTEDVPHKEVCDLAAAVWGEALNTVPWQIYKLINETALSGALASAVTDVFVRRLTPFFERRDLLLRIAKGMHEAEQREYGAILPCGQGRHCETCAAIAKAEERR